MNTVILPKGTIVHFHGFPCELTQDTEVYSASVEARGIEAIQAMSNSCQD